MLIDGVRNKVTHVYQLAHYGGYFDVSTSDVLFRLRKAILPFCAKAKILEGEKYDLYGPIWIMITLIVEIAIVGFISYQIDIANMVFEMKHGHPPTDYMSLYSL